MAAARRGARVTALADLDWRFSRGEALDLRSIPIERSYAGPPEDTDDDRVRLGKIDSRLRAVVRRPEPVVACVSGHPLRCPQPDRVVDGKTIEGCVLLSAPGSLLLWALRTYHSGPMDLPPADRMIAAFGALLVGAETESDEARVIGVRRAHQVATAALKAAKKAGKSGRASKIERGIAKRDLAEAAHVLHVVYSSPAANELAKARDAWGAVELAVQRGAMSRLHAAALAAYREAGG